MSSSIDSRRLFRESRPVAGILLFWVVVSWIGTEPGITTSLRLAGVVMALLYVGVRGVELAQTHPPTPLPTNVSDLLRENARVLSAAGIWFLPAVLLAFLEPYWEEIGLLRLFMSPLESLAFVFTGTGVTTVILYAIVTGVSRADGDASGSVSSTSETELTGD